MISTADWSVDIAIVHMATSSTDRYGSKRADMPCNYGESKLGPLSAEISRYESFLCEESMEGSNAIFGHSLRLQTAFLPRISLRQERYLEYFR